jgi:hypothetical protein
MPNYIRKWVFYADLRGPLPDQDSLGGVGERVGQWLKLAARFSPNRILEKSTKTQQTKSEIQTNFEMDDKCWWKIVHFLLSNLYIFIIKN